VVVAHPDDDAYGVAAVVALLVRGAMLEHRTLWDDMNTPEATEEQPVRVVVRMRRHHAQRSAYRGTLASAARFGYRSGRQPTDQRSRAVVFTLSMARTLDSSEERLAAPR